MGNNVRVKSRIKAGVEKSKAEKRENLFFAVIPYVLFVVGVFIRIFRFGEVPGGINQDEAFAGYEAFSLMNYGIDSWGYKNPVYFISWGSGMNVLNSYLMMPFMKLFGYSAVTIRLPQLIFSIATLPVFYLLIKKIAGKKCAVLGLFLLAISPWHIMLSKWGLESNLAPALLIFGLYFFVKAMDNNWFLPLSAFFYGLCLYAYATSWFFIPVVLIASGIYALKFKKIKSARAVIVSAVLLFLMALPLMLFVLVNLGVIGEIVTPYFSIPKMVVMRNGEMSPLNIFKFDTYKRLFRLLFLQTDNILWNRAGDFGIYYMISIPFMILGAVRCFAILFKKEFSPCSFIAINLGAALFVALLMWNANVNKINFIHLPIIACTAFGLEMFLNSKNKRSATAVLAAYALLFYAFSYNYYTDLSRNITSFFHFGLEDAAKRADEFDGDIYVDNAVMYPQLLFCLKQDTREYVETKKYSNYPSTYLYIDTFGKYHFTDNFDNLNDGAVYLVRKRYAETFEEKGFIVEDYDNMVLCYKEGTF